MVPPLGSLRLRPLTISDEAEVVAAHRQMALEQFTFALRWREDLPWAAYLALLEGMRFNTAVPEGLVPTAFLVAEVDGAIIGRASVRYDLNELLAHEGGHLGIACFLRIDAGAMPPKSFDKASSWLVLLASTASL